MDKKIVLAMLLTIAATAEIFAQKYTIEILPDKKVVYVARLGMPDYVPVSEVLQILPEFTTRGDELYSSFDIQYDGKSVGENRDATLFQTRLSEIEKIEISTSSVSTQQNSAYSGTINLVPKGVEDGVSGEIYLDATTTPNVMSGGNINYRKDGLQMRAFANFEGYWPENYSSSISEMHGYSTNSNEYHREDYFGQTARLNLKYDFSDRDVIKGWFLESWKNSRELNVTESEYKLDRSHIYGPGYAFIENVVDSAWSTSKGLLLSAKCEYQHKFNPESKLRIFAGIDGSPACGGSPKKSHTFNAQVKYDLPLFRKEGHLIKLETGVNTTLSRNEGIAPTGHSTYFSPHAQFKYRGPKWSVDATARYQHYDIGIIYDEYQPYNRKDNGFVADINALWQICDHHALRFSVSRNLIRPSNKMLYPGLIFNKDMNLWIRGNPDLNPAQLHTAEAEFIYDWSRGGHSVVVNAKAGFIRSNGLIEETYYPANVKSQEETAEYYVRYENIGINNILNLMGSALYQHGIMTLSVNANLYSQLSFGKAESDRNIHFNVSFSPIFNFQNDWMLSGRFVYNSPVNRSTVIEGESYFANIQFGKKIGRWSFHIEFSDIFDTVTTDTATFDDSSRFLSIYDMYYRYIGIGCCYKL